MRTQLVKPRHLQRAAGIGALLLVVLAVVVGSGGLWLLAFGGAVALFQLYAA
jgi:hypothetical protein